MVPNITAIENVSTCDYEKIVIGNEIGYRSSYLKGLLNSSEIHPDGVIVPSLYHIVIERSNFQLWSESNEKICFLWMWAVCMYAPFSSAYGCSHWYISLQFTIRTLFRRLHCDGGEDDDIFERLKYNKQKICCFGPNYSKYIMMPHKKERNTQSKYQNDDGKWKKKKHFHADGINSLNYTEKIITLRPLYTNILGRIWALFYTRRF